MFTDLLPSGDNAEAIVLLSAGLDSTVALYLANSLGFRSIALEFEHSYATAKPSVESQRVNEICAVAEVELYRIHYPTARDIKVNETSAAPQRIQESNQVYYGLAAALAISLNVRHIISGQIKDDWTACEAPECSPEYFKMLNDSLRIAYGSKAPFIHTPFIHLSKTEVAILGKLLSVPLDLTWSCNHSNAQPCLRCGQCIDRERALREMEIELVQSHAAFSQESGAVLGSSQYHLQ